LFVLQVSLYSAWQATSALRASVAVQKVQLHGEKHEQELDVLLEGQVRGFLVAWGKICIAQETIFVSPGGLFF
jgi:hypothetical protein